jgi:hypothetical protein
MGLQRDEGFEAVLRDVGLEPLTPREAESHEQAAVKVTVEGASVDDLARLLEDTQKFLKASGSVGKAETAYDSKEVMFRRVELNDFVIVAHRS